MPLANIQYSLFANLQCVGSWEMQSWNSDRSNCFWGLQFYALYIRLCLTWLQRLISIYAINLFVVAPQLLCLLYRHVYMYCLTNYLKHKNMKFLSFLRNLFKLVRKCQKWFSHIVQLICGHFSCSLFVLLNSSSW